MEDLTIQEKFFNITHLTNNIENQMMELHKEGTNKEKIDFLKKLVWLMPDGGFRDQNKDIAERDANFIIDCIIELDIQNVFTYFEDTNNDGVVDVYDIINTLSPIQRPGPKSNEIWYTGEYYDIEGVINFYINDGFIYDGPGIVSNKFDGKKWIITFDGPVTKIGIIEREILYPLFNNVDNGEGIFINCAVESVNIPNSVTSIGSRCFSDCGKLTSIIIPDSVTIIEDRAFQICTSLRSVTIPNSVTIIDSDAFTDCDDLALVTIGDNVTSIGERAFNCCRNLRSINIPDSVTSIGNCAFFNCPLKSVIIGKGVRYISRDSFAECRLLTSVTINSNTLLNGTYILAEIFGQDVEEYIIGNSVTSIGDNAFADCSRLLSVTIPDSVTSIGIYAFGGCADLPSITIPDSVTSIGESAFSRCMSLTSVTIGNSVTSIGWDAFNGCNGLTYINIPNSVISIGTNAFDRCDYLPIIDGILYADTYLVRVIDTEQETYTIKEGTRFIGSSAFSGCVNLTSIKIPDSVISIGEDAFVGCVNLPIIDGIQYADTCLVRVIDTEQETYTIKEGTKFIGNAAFQTCHPIYINIPDSVIYIGSNVFSEFECVTSTIYIPDSVVTIGDELLAGSNIQTLIIGNDIKKIGNFYERNELLNIHVSSLNEDYSSIDGVLFNKDKTKIIMHPQNRPNTHYIIPNSVTSIGYAAFHNCRSLISITIPNSVTNIENEAFCECNSLTSVTIPNSVTFIGDNAFAECTGLESIIIESIIPPIINSHSFGSLGSCSIFVPAEGYDNYMNDNMWEPYWEIIRIIE